MQTLRNANLLVRLVLAWFVVALGVAVAAPARSADGPWICTAGGALAQLAVPGDEDSTPQVRAGLDCPLCASVAAPPPASVVVALVAAAAQPLPLAPSVAPARPRASLPGARGPPLAGPAFA